MRAEQLSGIWIDFRYLEPISVVVGMRFLESETAEQKIGEQIGAALLLTSWIVLAEAARCGAEGCVNSRSIGGRHLRQ